MDVGGQRQAPAALPQVKRPSTHYTGCSLGPRASLNGWGKPRPQRDSIPGPSSQSAMRCATSQSRIAVAETVKVHILVL